MDNKDTRRLTREYAVQFLYQAEMQQEFDDGTRADFLSELKYLRDYDGRPGVSPNSEPLIDEAYFNDVVDAVISNLLIIDDLLESSADNWRLDRISKVELSVLRLSVAEIKYMKDIPKSVSINEAVELAKKFGDENSGKFVNGILGKIARRKSLEDE